MACEFAVVYRIKSYILKRRLMPKLMKPIHCREKWLVIAAIRFLRTCISMKDEFYYRCDKLLYLAIHLFANDTVLSHDTSPA